MKNKFLKNLTYAFALILSLGIFAACSKTTQNNVKYWFSDYTTNFVAFDETANDGAGNINEAGNYWNFTVKNDCKISLSFILKNNHDYSNEGGNVRVPFAEFFKNDVRVPAEQDVGGGYAYNNLELKKGDKLKLHALWLYGIEATAEGFGIELFTITDNSDGSNRYIISDF